MKPPLVEGSLLQGPIPSPPAYDEIVNHAQDLATLDKAMVSWFTAARVEWSSLAGQDV